MNKVLILGAGMVAKPMVHYLLENEFYVTIADMQLHKAAELIEGRKNANAIELDVTNETTLNTLIAEHNIVVSLLPYQFHVSVAKICIANKKSLVTTSYVQPQMLQLHDEAIKSDVLLLNEIGLDPGIDHMTAMRIIEKIHANNGKVEKFYSFCGALVAPEAINNPFAYKFTWAPRGGLLACNNNAKYLYNGCIKEIHTNDIFKNPIEVVFENIGTLEVYPNRDSIKYIDLYGISEVKTLMRGTFRYKGWCEIIDAMKQLGLLSEVKINTKGVTYVQFINSLIKNNNIDEAKKAVSKKLAIPIDSKIIYALDWLGYFTHDLIDENCQTPFDVTANLMLLKMMITENDRDMVVMQHEFIATYDNGKKELITAQMLEFGSQKNYTAISKTVALPAAIAVKLILDRTISLKGVRIPVIPQIYNPILNELETMNIIMKEKTETL